MIPNEQIAAFNLSVWVGELDKFWEWQKDVAKSSPRTIWLYGVIGQTDKRYVWVRGERGLGPNNIAWLNLELLENRVVGNKVSLTVVK